MIVFRIKSPLLAIVALVLIFKPGYQVSSLELRYKVCTAEELRRSVEQFCMRLGRDSGSSLSIGQYGSIGSDLDNGGSYNSDAILLEVLKSSRPYVRASGKRYRSSQRAHLFKRDYDQSGMQLCDYIDLCCNQSCAINPEDLGPFCKTI